MIHGAGIYANMTGVYGWDPCYHIYPYIAAPWIRHGILRIGVLFLTIWL